MAGQLIQRGESTWLIRVFNGRDSGGKRQYISKTVRGSKKDAQKELTHMLRDRDTNQLARPARQTVEAFLTKWLETSVRARLRSRTARDYSDVVNSYVIPTIGARKLATLNATDIRGMYVTLLDRKLSSRTVRKVHSTLHAALEQAVRDRLITHNPAKLASDALPRRTRREMRALTPTQAQTLIGALEAHPHGTFWLVLLTTGLRPGEALALRWSDVEDGRVSVTRALVDRSRQPLHFEQPKTSKSRRTVPLLPYVARALQAHRAVQAAKRLAAGPAWDSNDLVFCTGRGRPLRQEHMRKHFNKVLTAAELPKIRVYDLRHSFASLMGAGGVSMKVVSEMLGHSTITLTADTYSHVFDNMKEEAAAHLERVVFGTRVSCLTVSEPILN